MATTFEKLHSHSAAGSKIKNLTQFLLRKQQAATHSFTKFEKKFKSTNKLFCKKFYSEHYFQR